MFASTVALFEALTVFIARVRGDLVAAGDTIHFADLRVADVLYVQPLRRAAELLRGAISRRVFAFDATAEQRRRHCARTQPTAPLSNPLEAHVVTRPDSINDLRARPRACFADSSSCKSRYLQRISLEKAFR
jgi:hypothetical protein